MSDSSLATVDCVLEDVLETERVITEFGEVKVAAITSVRIKQPYPCVVPNKFSTAPYCIYEHIYLTIAPVSSAHDVMNRTRVTGFEAVGEYSVNLTYDVSLDKLVTFIDERASECRQLIKWECRSATIKNIRDPTIAVTYWANR